jgi:hypothetical protein
MRHGFISAGGGSWYSNSLNLLSAGDRIWVKAPKFGFVGVGRVRGKPVRAAEFILPTSDEDATIAAVMPLRLLPTSPGTTRRQRREG